MFVSRERRVITAHKQRSQINMKMVAFSKCSLITVHLVSLTRITLCCNSQLKFSISFSETSQNLLCYY